MKKLFTLLLLALLPFSAMAEGDDPVLIDGICYKLISKANVAEVVANPTTEYSGDIVIPSSVTYEGSEYSVEKINDYAFNNSTGITSVTIPSSVKSIGNSPFPYNLPSLNITDISSWCSIVFSPVGSNPFRNTDKVYLNGAEITELIIPEGVVSINEHAFEGLKSLTTISLPSSLKSIGSNAFQGCTSLKSLTLPSNLTDIGSGMAEGCSSLTSVILPAGIKYISTAAFGNCKELRDVYCLSTGVTKVYDNAFKDSYPEYITLHVPENSIESYKADAIWGNFREIVDLNSSGSSQGTGTSADAVKINELFYRLIGKALVAEVIADPNGSLYSGDIVIPSSVTYEGSEYSVEKINDYAFNNSTGITSVTIPSSVKSIGNSPFPYNLPSLNITDISSWCSIVFSPVGSNPFRNTDKVYLNGAEITELIIPEGVVSINEHAFEGLKSLTTISLPSSLKSIGSNAFQGCTSLKSLTLPSNLTDIGSGMAEGCSSLTSVILPASIYYIPTAAFGNCKELRDVYCLSTGVTKVYDNAFKDSYPEYITLHVPENSIESYKADAIWGNFREIVDLNSSGSSQGTGTSADAVRINDLFYRLIGKALVAEVIADPNGSLYSGNIDIPSSVTYEGSEYSVEKISDYAFNNSTGITSVTIPSSVKSIGNSPFPYNLPSLNITDISSWCSIVFSPVGSNPFRYTDKVYLNGVEITELIIPEGVASINEHAFEGLKSLITINLPSSLKSIGTNAFQGCTSLKSLTLPNNLTDIGSGMAEGCSSLTNVILPASIYYIPTAAFGNCKELRDVYCHSTDVTKVYENAFRDSYPEYITLHVPEKSVEAYKANTIWGGFKEIIGFHVDEPSEVVEIVTPDGEVIKTEITIEIIDENSKTAIIRSANIPASESGSTEIAIPAVVNGYTITSIDDNAFKGMTGVTDIYLPETDQPLTLGENALKIDDEHVATVHVPVGLLGSYAFNNQLAQNFNEGKVKATVTAPNRYWTFSAGVDVVVPEGVGVYICKYDSEDKVIITELDDSQLLVNGKRIIKANNGVLVACNNGTGGDAYDIVANPGGQSSMAPASYDAKSYGDDNMLEPVIVSKNYPATSYYVLKNGEFHKILANSSKMPAGKAVLRLPGVSNVRILSIIGGDDDTTGIYNRPIIEEESKWFDLQGRRIERPVKAGLYIKNGKKVVIK